MSKLYRGIPKIAPLPYKLHNVEDFIIRDHPKIDPIATPARYHAYWQSFTEKLIRGMWGFDYNKKTGEGGWRFMPNNLFCLVNCCWMKIQERGKGQVWRRPNPRDTDFHTHYGWNEMFGFSGFVDDKNNTCSDLVLKLEMGMELSYSEKLDFKFQEDYLRRPDGKLKKWQDPKEYLYGTFKEPMGHALYYNDAKNDMTLATRRYGKSEGLKSIKKRLLITNGAKSIEEYLDKSTNVFIILGAYGEKYTEAQYTRLWKSYAEIAHMGSHEYKVRTSKGFKKAKIEGYLWHPFTGSKKLGETMTNEVTVKGGKEEAGAGSRIMRVTLSQNASAMVGEDPSFINGTEVGTWNNILTPHNLTDPATRKDLRKFGPIAYDGTGGEMKNSQYARDVFLRPDKIGAVSYPDLYMGSNDRTCRFIPCYHIGRGGTRDDIGNLLLDEAYDHEMKIREEHRKIGMKSLIDHITQYPATPTDMFIQEGNNSMPTERASARLMMIRKRELHERENVMIGDIIITDQEKKKVKFIRDDEMVPITKSDMKKDLPQSEHKGAYVLYEPPILNSDGEQIEGAQYIACYDSIEHKEGTSLCVVSVFKFTQGKQGRVFFNIVAEKIYRIYGEDAQNKNDKEALKLAALYGCKFGPETNKPNILTYTEKIGWYDILEECPIGAIRNILPGASMKYDVGAYILPQMTDGLVALAAEVLMTAVDEEEDEDGNKSEVWMVDRIDSEFLLNDIVFYRKGGNYDYMSCFFVICLYIKQRLMDGSLEKGGGEGNNLFKKFMEVVDKYEQEQNDVFDF